jgi:oxygen-dependent protoporphyrinogen oxidase
MSSPQGPNSSATLQRADIVVIGAGLAGLVAADELKDLDVVVLERDERPGGRLLSRPAEPYWLNFGAHMVGGPDTPVGSLATRLGLETRPIRGRLMGMVHRGRRLLRLRPELFPLAMELSPGERLAMARMGLALRLGARRFASVARTQAGEDEHERRRRLRRFESVRTLSQYIGPLPPSVAAILRAITERTGADPDEMTAGHGLRSFGNVWSSQAPGRNIRGGSSLLSQALAKVLGPRVRLACCVTSVVQRDLGVQVIYRQAGESHQIHAAAAVVAVPASAAAELLHDVPAWVRESLRGLRAGPFLTAAALTHESDPMPWDGHYAIATPDRSFSVLFNVATTVREPGRRERGGSIMLFRGARGAARLMQESDASIAAQFRIDLEAEFPEARGLIGDLTIQRWTIGAPFTALGTPDLLDSLERPLARILLAGDYLEFPNLEAAAAAGRLAAGRARQLCGPG